MCEQAKILDVSRREAEFIERAPDDVLAEAVDILIGFVELS
jgi:mRNA interferase MazF